MPSASGHRQQAVLSTNYMDDISHIAFFLIEIAISCERVSIGGGKCERPEQTIEFTHDLIVWRLGLGASDPPFSVNEFAHPQQIKVDHVLIM